MKQRLDGPMLTRLAEPIGEGAIRDTEARRVRISFSSEQPVLRASFFDDPWVEILGHNEGEPDLSRLNRGGAVLHDHDRRRHIGVVERAWLEGGRAHADIRLSARDDVSDIWRDVQDGILTSTSVGYQINERALTRAGKDAPDEFRVTRWTPLEISLVSIPADHSVGVGRGDDGPEHFTIRNIDEDQTMSDKTKTDDKPVETRGADPTESTETRAAPPPVDVDAIRAESAKQAAAAERKRISQITEIGQRAQIDAKVIAKAIDDGLTAEQFRSGPLVDALIERAGPEIRTASIEAGESQTEKHREAATDWLLYRHGQPQMTVDGQPRRIDINDNPFRGMSLMRMAEHILQQGGVRTQGMDPHQLVRMAITHSTSDFPVVLENTMHKELQSAFGAVPDTHRQFSSIGSVSDFRPHYRYRMGTFGDILEVGENGEFLDATISDADREQIAAVTKGRILNISRQMIINDDLGAFLGVSRAMGRGAARTVEKDWYSLLLQDSSNGPLMGDGVRLFHSGSHSNVGGTGGITPATLDAARQLLANQMDKDNNDYIGLMPFAILVSSAYFAAMTQVLRSEGDPTSGNANSRKYNYARDMVTTVVSTPRISSHWYLFTAPSDEAVMEVAYLNGQQSPVLEMQEGFRVDGIAWKIRFDYAVGAVGWRGAVRTAVTA